MTGGGPAGYRSNSAQVAFSTDQTAAVADVEGVSGEVAVASAGSMKSNWMAPITSVPPSCATGVAACVSDAATKSPIPSPATRLAMSGLRAVGLGTMWKLDSQRAYAYATTAATSVGAQRALAEEGVELPGPGAAGGSRRRGVAAARGRQAARAAR